MEEINLRDFFEYLKKYILIFIAAISIAVCGTFLYNKNFKTPLYTASSSIVLYQSDDNANASSATLNEINVGQKLVSTYSELIKSELILQKVIDELHLDMSYAELSKNVSVKTEDNTMLLGISVKDADPERAAKIANKIAETFTETTIDKFNIKNISVWGEAKVPANPSNMTMTRDLLLAALIATFGVLAIAFIIFYFDDTVKYTEDIAERVKLPVAGKIVKSDIMRKSHSDKKTSVKVANTKSDRLHPDIPSEVVVERHPKAAVSESIKSLRTNLQFASVDQKLKTILVTSSLPGEGKTFVSVNLGASFAQTDKKVLIVDCDLRRGRLHKLFGLPNINGLSNLLTDDIRNFEKYVQETGIENLSVITRGTCPPNPSELLSSQKNKRLINQLRQKFDIIIFDGTPCNGLTDSIIMSTLVDEALIVVRNGFVPRSVFNTTKEGLENVGAKIAGVVPNQIARKTASYYTYYSDDDK